jgi:hypothetical protein
VLVLKAKREEQHEAGRIFKNFEKRFGRKKKNAELWQPKPGERKEQQALENIERPGTKGRVGVVNTSVLLRRKRKNECFLYFGKKT